MASTYFKSGRDRRVFSNFDDTFYVLWIVTITISITLFARGLAFSIFMANAIVGASEIGSHEKEHIVSREEHIGTPYLRKYVRLAVVSQKYLVSIFHDMPRLAPFFPKMHSQLG